MQFTIIIAFLLSSLALASPVKRQNFVKPFTLTAFRPGTPIDGKKIQAADQHFFIGRDGPSTYCPRLPAQSGACPNSTDTVMLNGALSVLVPGGQRTFVQRTGALAFNVAHSNFQPDFYSSSTATGLDLVYRGPWGVDWAACPVSNPGPGNRPLWQVFARIPEYVDKEGCICFEARATEWKGRSGGAWQYE